MMQHVGPHPALRSTFSRSREKGAFVHVPSNVPSFFREREKVSKGRMRAIAIRALPTTNHHRLAWTFATSDAHQSIA
ncbi:hypothetical protein [Xanthomonas hortorum]|uniref:Uncharacterized protein n=1 Tax=Xanthomonas hortorum pv. carotae TaxID=487904 RepID=A0A6V7EVV7_9XANT|nr:hypothetical protein [Xanthomonas hortorum]CAD0355352.1 hypothetical protein CFBP7900_27600 [Xanthomonas hortorum pv. carotae]CAD0355358.1 hypothetical protein CFBP7900_27600 [Xanthomonas hortorum pv. carotae]